MKRDTGFLMKNVEEFGTVYVSERIKWQNSKADFGAKLLRAKVMKVAQDSLFEEYLGEENGGQDPD